MKCEDCGKKLDPIVAIDIDGTLGDYHGHFLNFAREYLGRWEKSVNYQYDGVTPFKEWFCYQFECEEHIWYDIKLAYRQGGMKRSMPMFSGMARMIRSIRKNFPAQVWLTTTRPFMRLDNIDPDTRHWCERNAIEYDGLLYDEDKYQRLYDLVGDGRVVAVIDDLGNQYDIAAATFGPSVPLLAKGNYNRGISRLHEVVGPNDMYKAIKVRLER